MLRSQVYSNCFVRQTARRLAAWSGKSWVVRVATGVGLKMGKASKRMAFMRGAAVWAAVFAAAAAAAFALAALGRAMDAATAVAVKVRRGRSSRRRGARG